MIKTYHLTSITLSAPRRGRFAVPNFSVQAATPDEAADLCSKIVLCDRRTTDGILWTLAFTATSGEELVTFAITMREGLSAVVSVKVADPKCDDEPSIARSE